LIDIEFLRPVGIGEERQADWTTRALSPRGADWLRANRVCEWLTRGAAAWLRSKAEAEGLKTVSDDRTPPRPVRNPRDR
jgi:hypothetical protein